VLHALHLQVRGHGAARDAPGAACDWTRHDLKSAHRLVRLCLLPLIPHSAANVGAAHRREGAARAVCREAVRLCALIAAGVRASNEAVAAARLVRW
jgi:hypothetical protein